MTKTTSYQLNQWEVTDKLSRKDFNQDNAVIDAALAGKAEKSAITAVETALANKANAAEVSALSQSVSALSTALGGKGNCRIATGSYVGTGAFGVDNPNSLTFDFCPQVVWFTSTASNNQYQNGFFVRPTTAGKGLNNTAVVVSWSDNAVSWYCSIDNGYDQSTAQNNASNATYYWVVIGV